MAMITFNALVTDPTFKNWAVVNKILMRHMMGHEDWRTGGYLGMAKVVKEKFNITITRTNNTHVEFTFDTEQDYVIFLLRWL
jgi:hypothetical protein